MPVDDDVAAPLTGRVREDSAAEGVDVGDQVLLGDRLRRADREPDQAAHRGDHLLGGGEGVVATHEDVGGDAGLGKPLAEAPDREVAAAVLSAAQSSER